MLEAIKAGHVEIKKVCEFISKIKEEIGKPKFEYKSFEVDHDIYEEIETNFYDRMYKDVQALDKETRDKNMEALAEDVKAYFVEKYGEEKSRRNKTDIADSLYKLEKKSVRAMILNEHKRPDGRQIDEIRPLSCEVGILPRVHGSAVFTRGQTQSYVYCNTWYDNRWANARWFRWRNIKKDIFTNTISPGYSVGEAKPVRGPGRREIGHGALAERALVPVIPSEEGIPLYNKSCIRSSKFKWFNISSKVFVEVL